MTQPSPKALLRYLAVSKVKARLFGGMTQADAIDEVMQLPPTDSWLPDSGRQSVQSPRSLERWLKAYEAGGLAGLEPQKRKRGSTKLSPELLRFLEEQKTTDKEASVPDLIERARAEKVIAEDEHICRTTVWRACRRLGLPVCQQQTKRVKDMRRFAFPNRMMMVLADGKHFRAGPTRRKRVAIHLLDDATRFGLGVVVGTSENTELFLQALYKGASNFGRMKVLFLDNGSGFISEDTHTAVAQLGVHLIHGTACYPEGHGKIERFHRTLIARLLRTFNGNPEVDPDPAALTLRLSHWLQEVYNHQPHESLGGSTPAECWRRDRRALDFPKDPTWLDACFRTSCERVVSADNIVSFSGEAYEVPIGHAGSKLRLTRDLKDGGLSICHEGRLLVLHPVDLQANAYSRRGSSPKKGESTQQTPARTAGDLRFAADFAPITDADGNFPKGDQDES